MEGERAKDDAPGNGRRHGTEQRILDSAAALIREDLSWHNLGIRQIAERAELSRTAFYDFFASKQDVLVQLVSESAQELRDALRRPEAGPFGAAPSFTDPEPFLTGLAQFNDIHGPVYRAFVQALPDDFELLEIWRSLLAQNVRLVAAGIDHARAENPDLPRSPSSGELAEVLILMTERTMILLLREPVDAPSRSARLSALAHVWRAAVCGPAPGCC